MGTCKVYGTSPEKGPGRLKAQAALDDVNLANPLWVVVMVWNSTDTTYTSAVATGTQLENAFTPFFPEYTVIGN
jgi:hypothetical protein